MIWNLSRVKLVKKSSKCEDIDAFVVGSFLEELLGHVGWGSAELHRSAIQLRLYCLVYTLWRASPKSQILML